MTSTALAPKDLPPGALERNLTAAEWNTLSRSLFPGANPMSVLLVVDYCRARKLDPLKKPCHIVPMEVKDARTNKYEWRDVVMPGIYEHRTTAQRTELYLGHSPVEYGPEVEAFGATAPEWAAMTMYRWNPAAGVRAEFPVRVLFREVVALTRDKETREWKANARWQRAPVQMLTKCCEAAGLREAFPDELGGEQTAEEMDGQRAVDVGITEVAKPAPPKPDGYDNWLGDLRAVSEEGDVAKLEATWKASSVECRRFLTSTAPEQWEAIKARAQGQPETVDGDVVLGEEPPL